MCLCQEGFYSKNSSKTLASPINLHTKQAMSSFLLIESVGLFCVSGRTYSSFYSVLELAAWESTSPRQTRLVILSLLYMYLLIHHLDFWFYFLRLYKKIKIYESQISVKIDIFIFDIYLQLILLLL